MVTPAGLEPATFRSGGERSNPLSYGAMNSLQAAREETMLRSHRPRIAHFFFELRLYVVIVYSKLHSIIASLSNILVFLLRCAHALTCAGTYRHNYACA